jgi:hypothetical protein
MGMGITIRTTRVIRTIRTKSKVKIKAKIV